MRQDIVYISYSIGLCIVFVLFLQRIRNQGLKMRQMKNQCKICIHDGPENVEDFGDTRLVMYDKNSEKILFVTENCKEHAEDLISIGSEISNTHSFHFMHLPDLMNVSHTVCIVKETKETTVCIAFINL